MKQWVVTFHYIGKDNVRHYRVLRFKNKELALAKSKELTADSTQHECYETEFLTIA